MAFWRRTPFDVVVVPLVIFVLTYVLSFGGYSLVLTSAALYLAAWHRRRQNFGIARYYQARFGGPASPWHRAPHPPVPVGTETAFQTIVRFGKSATSSRKRQQAWTR